MYSSSECNSFPKSDTSALPALGASATKTEQGGAETQQNHNKLLKAGSLVDLPFCINVLGGIWKTECMSGECREKPREGRGEQWQPGKPLRPLRTWYCLKAKGHLWDTSATNTCTWQPRAYCPHACPKRNEDRAMHSGLPWGFSSSCISSHTHTHTHSPKHIYSTGLTFMPFLCLFLYSLWLYDYILKMIIEILNM